MTIGIVRAEDRCMTTLASRLAAASALVVALGCGTRVEEDPAADSTTTGGTTDAPMPTTTVGMSGTTGPTSTAPTGDATGDATGDLTSGTTQSVDPDGFCEQFLDRETCQGAQPPVDVFCDWTVATPVRLLNGQCQQNQAVGACTPLTGGTTSAGCSPPEGCDSEPFFLPGDGQVFVIFQCGGSLPIGYEPCALIEPGLFDPPECGCLCDAPGATTGTSDDGSSSG